MNSILIEEESSRLNLNPVPNKNTILISSSNSLQEEEHGLTNIRLPNNFE